MADNHVLNTRIKLKYDTYENWIAKDPVLLAGEVAIATVASNDAEGKPGFQNLPNIVFKVGDGSSEYSKLKFVSALAADVHGWAKEANKPAYTAQEIGGIKDYIDGVIGNHGEIQDTNTTYTMAPIDGEEHKWGLYSMEKGSDAKALVYTLDLTGIDKRLDDVEAALGEGGSVATKIAKAVEALDYAGGEFGTHKFATKVTENDGIIAVEYAQPEVADINGLETALAGKQDNLKFADEEKNPYSESNPVATKATVTDAIGALDSEDNAVEKEFVTAVSEVDGVITVSRAALKATDIPNIEMSQVNLLAEEFAKKQDVLAIADGYNAETNKVATEATVTAAVAKLEGAMHFRGRVYGDTFEEAIAASDIKDWAAGDVVLYGEYEYVFDNTNWLELGNTNLYQLKADAEAQHKAMQDEIDALETSKQDALHFEGVPSEDNKVITNSAMIAEINEQINTLDYDGGEFGEHKFATKIVEDGGVIAATYAQPVIADIAGLTDRLTGIDGEIAKKQDILGFAGETAYDKTSNPVATADFVNAQIGALTKKDEAVEGEFVTAVSEEGGIVTVARGQVTTDHIQQGAKVLVFDCGTATL